jgi:hypothetical protein
VRLLFAALVLCAAGQASAAEPAPTAIRVAYVAPDGCPNEKAFTVDVTRRSTRIVASDEHAQAYEVNIDRAGAGFVGRVRLAGSPDAQEHRASTCQAVASALALSLALSIDPDARTDAAPPPIGPPIRRDANLELPALRDVVVRPEPTTPRALRFGLDGDVVGIAYGAPLIGASLALDSVSTGAAGTLLGARLGFRSQVTDPLAARAFVRMTTLALVACIGRLGLGAVVAVRPCLGAEPGLAFGTGQRITDPTTAVAFWLSVSARLAVEVAVADGWTIFGEFQGFLVPIRPRFYVEPGNDVAIEAGLGGVAGAIGLRRTFL